MINYQIDVTYTADSSNVTWGIDNQTPRPIKLKPEDTISFAFHGPGEVTDAVLLTGPRKKNTARSPFRNGNQINIEPNAQLAIDNVPGLWGFSISFTVSIDGISKFLFLPDPELEVGST